MSSTPEGTPQSSRRSRPRTLPANPLADPAVRDGLLADPDRLLDDRDLMRALVASNDQALGGNVIDLRGVAMERLSTRLERLEDTHQTVIAAAHENLAGTGMVHRAVLRLLQAEGLEPLVAALSGPVAQTLRVECLRLLVETGPAAAMPGKAPVGGAFGSVEPGFVDRYVSGSPGAPTRPVTLRACTGAGRTLWGGRGVAIRSEACLRIDPGRDRGPALLVLGAEDPGRFTPSQGTDLLAFLADALGLCLGRVLP